MRILHVVHDFLPRHRAGVESYVLGLCQEQARGDAPAVLCADYLPHRRHGSVVRREYGGITIHEVVNNWHWSRFEDTYRSSLMAEVTRRVLADLRPDVIHVHSLATLTLDLPVIAREHGIPVVATLHDYSLVCPSGGQRLSLDEGHICAHIEPRACSRCFVHSPHFALMALPRLIRGRPLAVVSPLARAVQRFPRAAGLLARGMRRWPRVPVTPAEMQARRDHVDRVLDATALFVAPSAALGQEMVRLGVPGAKLVISDCGSPASMLPRAARRPGPPRIGFVGTLAPHKGAHVLIDAARLLAEQGGCFEVVLFGSLRVFPSYVASLRRAAAGLPVRFAGSFHEADRARVYGALDLLVVPSLWPENSPLVIHEAFLAGVPVVAAARGGMVALLGGGRHGVLFEPTRPYELARILSELIDSPQRRAELARGARAVKSLEDDAQEWAGRYRRV